MARKKVLHIYLLKDEDAYIYDWQTRYCDPDDYDHRRFTILNIPKERKKG